ncbi:hypothetical protein ACH5RR_036767 [Cinchona calisaya]|uniref:Uncharacterized protein n=1 Tax=Cinchona calisaya TaxID=153742 RepID=A0ABD2Y472_9GENT
MKNQLSNQVIRISRSSVPYLLDKSRKRILHGSCHSDESPKTGEDAVDSLISRKYRFGIKVDNFAKGTREHVRLAPKLTESVKGKLSLGARIIQIRLPSVVKDQSNFFLQLENNTESITW